MLPGKYFFEEEIECYDTPSASGCSLCIARAGLCMHVCAMASVLMYQNDIFARQHQRNSSSYVRSETTSGVCPAAV